MINFTIEAILYTIWFLPLILLIISTVCNIKIKKIY
jgi:hypothetical protein